MARQGHFVQNEKGYKSFKPSDLKDVENRLNIDDEIKKLAQSINEKLIRINMKSDLVKDSDLFLYAYVYEEAVESSKIEGTECTMEDIFENINKFDNNNALNIADIKETISNINAIEYGVERLKELPLSTRLYKEIHKILLNNVRGEKKSPGELRTSQNWIGGKSIKDASFIPPNVEDMNEALSELDKYINDENENINKIIKCALIHYQFETIHPFLDGNGRLGRIIILLYLIKEKLLNKPYVYMSYFLKINQIEYYNKLIGVREKDKYEEYIKFFLNCFDQAADSVLKRMDILNELHNKNISKLPINNRKKKSHEIIFNYIELHPIFTIKEVAEKTKLSFNTVNSVVKKFEELDIIKKQNLYMRNKVYIYEEYVNVFKRV